MEDLPLLRADQGAGGGRSSILGALHLLQGQNNRSIWLGSRAKLKTLDWAKFEGLEELCS